MRSACPRREGSFVVSLNRMLWQPWKMNPNLNKQNLINENENESHDGITGRMARRPH